MGSRVLIIEDNADTALTLQAFLQAFGHDVAVAFTGPTGLQKASDWKPDVVISDIGLPGMDGFEVARRLRRNSETANVFLIGVSGYGTVADKHLAEQAGFNFYFVKPL